MTERFTLIECNGNIEDGCTQNVYDGGEDVFELLDLLNSLNDKNEQLEKEAEEYNEDAISYQTLYEQQLEKNEQLIRRNKKLEKHLRKFYCDEEWNLRELLGDFE